MNGKTAKALRRKSRVDMVNGLAPDGSKKRYSELKGVYRDFKKKGGFSGTVNASENNIVTDTK